MAKKYIGITIGPIFNTINLTSSPAALWAASYLFSLVSKTICEKLVENGVAESDIVTPYYKKDDEIFNRNDGIGLFHDRIIFKSDRFELSEFNKVKNEAVSTVSEIYGIDKAYLDEYIMIASAEFEADNPIMESGKILDSLELAVPYVYKEEFNPVLALFSGSENSKNDAIKAMEIVTNFDNFQLKKNSGSLKSLPDIVHTGDGFKKYKYYAIVRSDGDNMSEIIKSLDNDEQIREFSRDCLNYCSEVAKLVSEYNGVTIYSGGDDLLAILPCESKSAKTPFDFVADANGAFKSAFEKYNKPTSLSFGITMAYYKFPLYEALSDSADLLFKIAKQKKNGVAVRLQKHAGQSEGLFVSNSSLNEFINLQKIISEDKNDILVSALHKVAMFKDLFNASKDEITVENIFKNTFDADAHKNNEFVGKNLPSMFYKLQNGVYIKAVDENGLKENDTSLAFCYMLRLMKFFIEKGGEE